MKKWKKKKNEEKRKKRRGELNLVDVLVICLGRIGIENVSFHVDILRLSQICGLIVYFVMGGDYCNFFLEAKKASSWYFIVGGSWFYDFLSDAWCDVPVI